MLVQKTQNGQSSHLDLQYRDYTHIKTYLYFRDTFKAVPSKYSCVNGMFLVLIITESIILLLNAYVCSFKYGLHENCIHYIPVQPCKCI